MAAVLVLAMVGTVLYGRAEFERGRKAGEMALAAEVLEALGSPPGSRRMLTPLRVIIARQSPYGFLIERYPTEGERQQAQLNNPEPAVPTTTSTSSTSSTLPVKKEKRR